MGESDRRQDRSAPAPGFPAGPKGLFARFLQGYLYPSYTGSAVTAFRSQEAEKMWTDFKILWASVKSQLGRAMISCKIPCRRMKSGSPGTMWPA